MENKSTDLILLILIVSLVGGFYLTIGEISSLKQSVNNLEMNLELGDTGSESGQPTVTPGEKATSTEGDELTPVKKGDAVVPTAILFYAESSPLLSPQTDIAVAVQRVVKEKESGVIRLYLKAYTNNAESYSALDPGNLFEIVDPTGQNQKPLQVNGRFDSIPPQSFVTGEVIFKVSPDKNSVIIKISSKEGDTYYKFNFEEKSYEETALG